MRSRQGCCPTKPLRRAGPRDLATTANMMRTQTQAVLIAMIMTEMKMFAGTPLAPDVLR